MNQSCPPPSDTHQRPHREFVNLLINDSATRWNPTPSSAGRIEHLTLCDNFETQTRTGTRTRISRWAPGAVIASPVLHDFFEEVLLLEGELVVGCDAEGNGGQVFEPMTYACRPPGVWHGPFAAPKGCLMLEFYYYR